VSKSFDVCMNTFVSVSIIVSMFSLYVLIIVLYLEMCVLYISMILCMFQGLFYIC
jgi:hypothetical protein